MRHLLTAFTAAAFALSSPAGAQTLPAAGADAVLAAASSALGATNLAKLPSFKATATGTFAGLPATLVSYSDLANGGRNATYAKAGLLSQDSGNDGEAVWTRDSKGIVWVEGSQQGRAAAINEAYRESYALWTPSHGGATVTLAAPQTDAGVTYDVVRVTPPGSVAPFDVWLDRTTHLPARYVETTAAVTTTTTLSNYSAVAGVMLPFAIHQVSDTGNTLDEKITHVDIAPANLAAKIAKPASGAHDFSIAGGNTTTVPFELIDNHVYLDVMLNGKGPYRFIFDTGGSNVVDPAVAKEIGATSSGSMQGGGVGATTEEFSFAKVGSLGVGKAELRDQVFSVLPVRKGFGIAGGVAPDGLIGSEVLARYVTVFDYANNRVTFKLPGAGSQGTAVPFVFAGTQPEIPCGVDGITAQCTIDTGSRSSLDLFAPFIASNPQVVPANATEPGINGFGVGGADVGRLGRVSLQMGGFDLKGLIAGLSIAKAGAFAVPGIAANIGGATLKRFTVTFDYAHQTMSLVPNAALDAADEFDRSGIFAINRGAIVVAAVRPGTPAAAAGIQKGDAILSIDDLHGARLTLTAAREAFRKPSGTVLHLSVVSNGGTAPHPVTLTLSDYV